MKKILLLLVFITGVNLYGAKMDFMLYNLYEDENAFNKVSTQFLNAMAPHFLGEADSRGSAGFEIGLGYTLTKLDVGKDDWEKATADKNEVNNRYDGFDLHIRKGIIFGLSIYGNFRYFLNTEMVSGGVGAEYAVNEGFLYFPDVSVGFGYNKLYGATDLNMELYELRLKISKSFPIGGELKLIPTFAFSRLMAETSSKLLGGYRDNNPKDNNNRTFIFKNRDLNINRVALGFKFVRGRFSFILEGVLPFKSDSAVSFNSGLSFIF